MNKTRKILLAVVAVVIVALLAFLLVTNAADKQETCTICHGELEKADACGDCLTDKDGNATGKVEATIDGETVLVDCSTCEGSAHFCENCENAGEVTGSFWALLPPIIAIGLALITKEVYSSLFIGILSGAIIYAGTSFSGVYDTATGVLDTLTNSGIITAVAGTAGIFVFLVLLGVIVALINKTGGSYAFGRWASTHIKSKVGAALATFALGVLIFIDDYFNCLTVGSVMRPVTDRHGISRSKLAYLIDATAAPICMIAPISSWAAAVSQYADDGKGLKLFVTAIPYNFYSLLTIVFVIAIIAMGYDYGSMRIHEYNAVHKGDLFTSGERVKSEEVVANERGRVIDLVLPIVILIASCVFGLLHIGGISDGADFITAFGDTDATVGLPWGAFIALVLIFIYVLLRKLTTFKEAMKCIPSGFIAMVPAILILTFATALKEVTSMLGAKYFIAALMDGAASGLSNMLPAIIFVVACVLSFATGTSWGTFGILIPIVTAIFPASSELMIIGMSACLAGAVCGDHCSPISDTTIMASAGAECDHLNHVSTQLPYAITVAIISFVMFVIAGFVQNAWICLAIGVVLTLGTLFVLKALSKKRHIESAE
ncbi:MAG: Na+/H+ antiporter NhaC family protein [Clostridia bacterium]|nr:Na+/H+ antiporter NhaC family protein [Clostridia bacterium]